MQVLSINAPSSVLSIKYSLQCALIASATEADRASAVTRYACLVDTRWSLLFNGDQFAPYFIRPQTIEPNTIRSEVADTRRYDGDTPPLLRELKGRLHHVRLILNARREAGLFTDGR